MLSVRRIQLGEGELFKQMRLASLHESPTAFSTTYESALARSAESWGEQADNSAQGSDHATFIAFSDDLPIGITALYRDGEKIGVGEVLQVWVAPEYRSKGVALNLMDAVFQWLSESDFQKIIIRVAKGNTRALGFYRKYGFNFDDGIPLDILTGSILVKGSDVGQVRNPTD